jgi:tRNA(Ile)-lysidine synthase
MPRNRHKSPKEKTLETLKKYLKGGETVICGVSGGPDSVFLLHCLANFSEKIAKIKIVVFHVNHSLRGLDAELDENHVKILAKSFGFPYHVKKIDVLVLAKSKKQSLEEISREIRYNFALELQKKYKADFVTTAHHADDNLETVLLNLIRGSGLKGLSGMKEISRKRNGLKLLRPLLNISKEEIRLHLEEKDIDFRIDQSNLDTKIPRNYVRHEIIPKLKALNPNVQKTILKNSTNILDIHDYLKEKAKKWISEHENKFDTKELKLLPKPIQKEILLQIYKKKNGNTKNLEAVHIDEVLEIISKNIGRKQKKLGKYTVEIQKGTFILR